MDATIIYPHQLFKVGTHPALTTGRAVYLVEETLLLNYNPSHRARLLLIRNAMQSYRKELLLHNHKVKYLDIHEYPTTDMVFKKLYTDGISKLHIVDTTDNFLERSIVSAEKKFGFSRVFYDSPMFYFSKTESMERYLKSRHNMARFYKQIRIDTRILMNNNKPLGGQFSFDLDNRKKIPKKTILPDDIILSPVSKETFNWLKTIPGDFYGKSVTWLPHTHKEAEKFLKEFLRLRLINFGPYEDAIDTTHTRLWHSTLSPLLNIGLLTPKLVIETTLHYAEKHQTPIQSLEGFIRQIIGWREFIRASYEVDGSSMRQKNFFYHKNPLPKGSWNGNTSVQPLDNTITTTLNLGYTHHIERLMVAGNFFLLTRTHPHAIYHWFMAMYIDAYDWVMVPNIYGMSQFADGGSFATKPYISGSSYLRKMSNYPKGDWEGLWTALYWLFIYDNHDFFSKNHRLSMMPKLLEKMDSEKRKLYFEQAKNYLDGYT